MESGQPGSTQGHPITFSGKETVTKRSNTFSQAGFQVK